MTENELHIVRHGGWEVLVFLVLAMKGGINVDVTVRWILR